MKAQNRGEKNKMSWSNIFRSFELIHISTEKKQARYRLYRNLCLFDTVWYWRSRSQSEQTSPQLDLIKLIEHFKCEIHLLPILMGHLLYDCLYKTVSNGKGFHCRSQADQSMTAHEIVIRVGKLRAIIYFLFIWNQPFVVSRLNIED